MLLGKLIEIIHENKQLKRLAHSKYSLKRSGDDKDGDSDDIGKMRQSVER